MSAMASFWWDECDEKRKIHWLSWDKICMSKENRGLGFKDIEDFNQALLAKQAWRLLNDPNSLIARLYKGRYYANKDFIDCGKGYRPSYAWRSILFGKELLCKGLIRSIGNGRDTYVWAYKWILDDCPRRSVNKETMIDVNLRVCDLIQEGGHWNVEALNRLFPVNEVTRILQMPVGTVPDKEIWAYTDHGAYTVKSGYRVAMQVKETQARHLSMNTPGLLDLKKMIWQLPTLPKIRSFLWRAASGALAVAERLNTRGLQVDPCCKLCRQGSESI